jgi:RimJ/RimL family protein N-acetyltransferase
MRGVRPMDRTSVTERQGTNSDPRAPGTRERSGGLTTTARSSVAVTMDFVNEQSATVVAAWVANMVARWTADGIGNWMGRDRSDGSLLGRGGFARIDLDGETVLESGWMVRDVHTGRGYATEPGQAALA